MSKMSIRKSHWQMELVSHIASQLESVEAQYGEARLMHLSPAPALSRLKERMRKRPQQVDPRKVKAKRAYTNGFYEDDFDQQWPIHAEILDYSGAVSSGGSNRF